MFFATNNRGGVVHPNVQRHWVDQWAHRDMWDAQHEIMLAANRAHMSPEILACNAFGEYGQKFWQQLDAQVVALRGQTVGMEVLEDLLPIQKTLGIGKTVGTYNVRGDIADDVQISMDGQAPYSFDHPDYDSDGDPVPVFTAGYGVNWRLAAGLNTVGIDLVLDAQESKLRKYNEMLVGYLFDGSDAISVDGKRGQGLRNHRHTKKINLGNGAGGVSIDLTTASQQELIDFFSKGAFGQNARANYVSAYDVVWVSPEVWANMDSDYINGGVISGTVRERIIARSKIKDIRETYKLQGNEFMGYERRSDVLRPLVGMTTGIVPLPRPLPQTNYNFQIMGAMGVQVLADEMGRGGVVYGADFG